MKPTIVLQGRINLHSLATLVSYYSDSGRVIRSKSHLLNVIVQDLAEILGQSGQARVVTSTEEAVQLLHMMGMEELTKRRSIFEDLSLPPS